MKKNSGVELRKIVIKDLHGDTHQINRKDIIHRVAACGVLVKNGKYLLIKEDRLPQWEFPGGGIENGEMTHEALIREFKEETGLNIKINELITFREGNFYHLEAHAAFYTMRLFFSVSVVNGISTLNSGAFIPIKDLNDENTNTLTLSVIKELEINKKKVKC